MAVQSKKDRGSTKKSGVNTTNRHLATILSNKRFCYHTHVPYNRTVFTWNKFYTSRLAHALINFVTNFIWNYFALLLVPYKVRLNKSANFRMCCENNKSNKFSTHRPWCSRWKKDCEPYMGTACSYAEKNPFFAQVSLWLGRPKLLSLFCCQKWQERSTNRILSILNRSIKL